MEDNEDEPTDVRNATSVQEAILQGNKDEKNVDKERRVKSAASSRHKSVERKLKNKNCTKFPRANKIRKPCHEKMEIVCRDDLTKAEYLSLLSASKKTVPRSECRRMRTEPKIDRRGKSGYANCTSHRIEELAKPTRARTMSLLEHWGSRLRPEIIDSIVESLQENWAMSPEQMEAYRSDKKRQRNQMRRRRREKKCPGKDKKKRSCDDNLDKEAVCQEYAMARRFTRHIVARANNGPFSSDEHYDLTEAILQQLVDHLDCEASGESERRFQMMLVLANGIADWIHGLNLTVAEKLDNDRSSRELEDTDSEEGTEDETGGSEDLEQHFVHSDEEDESDEDDDEARREADQTRDDEIDEEDEEGPREAEQTRDDGGEDTDEAEQSGGSDGAPRGTDEASGTHPDQVDARTQSDKEQGVNTDATGEASDDAVAVDRASGQDETTGTEEDVGQDAASAISGDEAEAKELDDPEEDSREVESDDPEEPRTTTTEEDEVDEIPELDEDEARGPPDEEVDREISVLSVMEQIDGTEKLLARDGMPSDIPFVTLGKILEIGVKNLKKFEAAETSDVRRRLQNAIFGRLTNLVRAEDAAALNDNMKTVLEILAENVAVFVEDALPASRINEIRNMDPKVESTDIRNWGQWLDNVMDNASMWSNWIHETVTEAREKARNKVTRADWQQWTSDVETEALRWRLFNLDTKHRMHHADLNLAHKRVVHRRESAMDDIRSRNSSLPPFVANDEAELETHDLTGEQADQPELSSGIEENEPRYSHLDSTPDFHPQENPE